MNHNHHGSSQKFEYIKFFGVMLLVATLASCHALWFGFGLMQFLESFMGSFFVVFSFFKFINLKEFAYGFQSYDLIARKSLFYSFSYPFMQLALGLLYLFGQGTIYLDTFVLLISLISGIGVLNSLLKKQAVHCVCLGNVIKLPLSTISFVEDFGMALMAAAMIFLR